MSKIGRNKLCPCGSGKKNKNCCGTGAPENKYSPNTAEYFNEQGNSLADQGLRTDAILCYEQALKINPDFAGAWNNLGITFKDLGLFDKAVFCYQRALELAPTFAGAYNNLGVALKEQGQYEEAISCYRNALALVPDSVQINTNLGNILFDLNRHDDAIPILQNVLKIAPDFSASCKLGISLLTTWRYDEAIDCYQRALLIVPDSALALNNLGVAYNGSGRLGEAIACYRKALSVNPGYADAYCGLGSTLKDRCQLDEALECYQMALNVRPDYTVAYSNFLMTQQYDFSITSEEVLVEARNYARKFENSPQSECLSAENAPKTGRKLKIGFVSADLRNHPVGYFLEAVLQHLNRDSLSLTAYAHQPVNDSLSERIRPFFDKWVAVTGMSDNQLADRIRLDGIDLLIDLSGHTKGNRLPVFASRPAAVQATWLGYANTTGLDAMDFILADPVTIPAGEEQFYTEKVWRLPETYVCFTPPDMDIPINSQPALEQGYITFGCFNTPAKLNDTVISCWADILHGIPNSVLHLKNKIFDHESERKFFRQRFHTHRVDPARLRFDGASDRGEYLAAYREVDFCLDPFPFPGLTTTCEALWMGVPTLTLKMSRGMYGHNGELVMKSVGLDNWVAESIEDYRERARKLAADLERLSALRRTLRQTFLSSPLCAAERFAGNLEDAFQGMIRMSTVVESRLTTSGEPLQPHGLTGQETA